MVRLINKRNDLSDSSICSTDDSNSQDTISTESLYSESSSDDEEKMECDN